MIILDKLTFFVNNIRDIFTRPILQIGALMSYKEVRKKLIRQSYITDCFFILSLFQKKILKEEEEK